MKERDNIKETEPEAIVTRWLKEIDHVKKSKRRVAYEKLGEKIVKNYANISAIEAAVSRNRSPNRVMFNVLWSNVQVLKPALYARIPEVVVERTFKDSDPIGNLTSRLIERATTYNITSQKDRYHTNMKMIVEDRLLPGGGFGWVRFEVEKEQATDEAGNPVGEPTIKPNSERAVFDWVHWKNFYWSECRSWFELRWIAREVQMTRAKLCERFPHCGAEVELQDQKEQSDKDTEYMSTACVYEIQDIESKNTYWISPGYKDGPLDVKKDHLRLKNFWAAPRPLLATTTTDSLYPTPDYKIYEALAEELDNVTKRIGAMAECIRLVGAVAKQWQADVKNMLKLRDGEMWPVEQWTAFAERGGLKSVVDWMPFEQCIAAIGPLQSYQTTLLAQIGEISSIPDIVRGASDPTESAAAVQKKSRWTVLKLEEKQGDVQRFWEEVAEKTAEILCEPGFVSDETFALMCGIEQMSDEDKANYPAALKLARDDRLRTFRVSIATDSTIALDEAEEQASRMGYMEAVGGMFSNVQNTPPALLTPMIESALFVANAFRTGRSLSGAWDKALREMEEQAKNPAPPPPDYQAQQLEILQMDSQTKQMEAQTKQQIAQADIQAKMATLQAEQGKAQMEFNEAQARAYAAQVETQLKQQAEQFKQFIETEKLKLENQKLQQDGAFQTQKLEVEASKVMTKDAIDKMQAELQAAKQISDKEIEEQWLELEKQSTILREKEKLIEEKRLASDNTLEMFRLIKDTQSQEPQQPPVVNVHVPEPKPRKLRVKRDAKGAIEEIGDADD